VSCACRVVCVSRRVRACVCARRVRVRRVRVRRVRVRVFVRCCRFERATGKGGDACVRLELGLVFGIASRAQVEEPRHHLRDPERQLLPLLGAPPACLNRESQQPFM